MPDKIPVTTLAEMERLFSEGIADKDDWEEFIDAYLGVRAGWKGYIYPNKTPKALLAHGQHDQKSHGNRTRQESGFRGGSWFKGPEGEMVFRTDGKAPKGYAPTDEISEEFSLNTLKNGNPSQQSAHKSLMDLGIMDDLAQYNPLVAGTVPLDIHTKKSDLDILVEVHDIASFEETLNSKYGHLNGFTTYKTNVDGLDTIVANFDTKDGWPIEVFGQARPPKQQHAFVHMAIEKRLLNLAGEPARQAVKSLKEQGIKTEPAFGQAFGIEGNPYSTLVKWASLSDKELQGIIRTSFALVAHGEHDQQSHGNWATGTQTEADQSPAGIVQGQMPRKEVGAAVRETFKSIDSVHNVPDGLPKIPIRTNRQMKPQATYSYREAKDGSEIPVKIEVNPDTSLHVELSFAHEFGHYLDSQVFSRGSTKEMKALEDAINKSQAMDVLDAIATSQTNTARVKGAAKYYLSRHEAFARAYAQYIAMKSQNQEMVAQVNGVLLFDRKQNNVYPYTQWGQKDFAPIMKAMDNLFKSKGLLK